MIFHASIINKQMFGLQNYRGSCWVNGALQALFRIPDVQDRYTNNTFEKDNVIDQCLYALWKSKGEHGLKDFFEAVRTDTMPAGLDIGDSHELIHYLCDKLPFLDKLLRFKVAHSIECIKCKKKSVTEDSVIEFSLDSAEGHNIPLSDCIAKTVEPYIINEWVCEYCKTKGGNRQQLIGSFPQCMMFHAPLSNTTIQYPSILVLNKHKYALSSVVCYNGAHWWAYGRDMPPGTPWYAFDDERVREHSPKQFPVSTNMRIMIYYRLDE
jgi:ubiquitin C-terminal hydrolase